MANIFLTTNLTSTYTQASGDRVTLVDGARITSTGDGISATHDGLIRLNIYGDIYATNIGLNLGLTESDDSTLNVLIGPSATIDANLNAVIISREFSNLVNYGTLTAEFATVGYVGTGLSNFSFINHGIVRSFESAAVFKSTSNGTTGDIEIVNSGVLAGETGGSSLFDTGIYVSEENLFISNTETGEISGGSFGIYAFNNSVATFTLQNAGDVTSYSVSSSVSARSAVSSSALTNSIENTQTGTIAGNSGIRLTGGSMDDTQIVNGGTITGRVGDGIDSDSGNFTLINQQGGTITGGTRGVEVDSVGDDVSITNHGAIAGLGDDGLDINTGFSSGSGIAEVVNTGTITGSDLAVLVVAENIFIDNGVGAVLSGTMGAVAAGSSTFQLANAGSITARDGDGLSVTADAVRIANDATGRIDAASDTVEVDSADTFIMTNLGTVSSGGGDALELSEMGSARIYNGATGTIEAEEDAVFFTELMGTSGSLSIVNAGAISSRSSEAVDVDSGTLALTNLSTGQIVGDIDAVGEADSVRNAGEIVGSVVLAGGNDSIINGGSLAGFINMGGGDDTIRNGTDGFIDGNIAMSAGEDILINAGRIEGDVAMRPGSVTSDDGVLDTLINRGTLIGDVAFGSGGDTLVNSGEMVGDIDLGDGADILSQSGLITGNVEMGDGNDQFNMILGSIEGSVIMGDGNDVVRNRTEIVGNVDLGDGNDTYAGQTGTLDGQVFAGAGNDTVLAGDDGLIMTGGLGRDRLFGGDGEDRFVFTDAADSNLSDGFDILYDFQSDEDLIDLAAVAPGQIGFRGTNGFSAGGTAEVAIQQAGTSALVRIDVDGNGTEDMRILLANMLAADVTMDDFVL